MKYILLLAVIIYAGLIGQAFAGKKDLAEKMNELRPVGLQVDRAIAQMAQSLPEDDQEAFTSYIQDSINYRAIEKISIDAMAETFTEEELEAMVEYYSKAEAQSAAEKLIKYQEKVSPEIIRMIDKAMMKARTGGN